MVHTIHHSELQLNMANASDADKAFLDLNLCIHNDTVSTKIYDIRDDFDNVNFPMAMSLGVPLMVYISAYSLCRAFLHVNDFDSRIKFLTAKLLK